MLFHSKSIPVDTGVQTTAPSAIGGKGARAGLAKVFSSMFEFHLTIRKDV